MHFDSYHPTINFIYFIAVISGTLLFNQPIFLIISLVCPFIFSIVLNGKKALIFNLILLLGALIFMAFYSSYNHFGITTITTNSVGNRITLESIVYGGVLGIQIISLIMWISCIHATITSDKIVYLLGRFSPRLSLYISMILRALPHIKEYTRKILVAQQGIGRGLNQGNIFQRIFNFFRIISIVLTWIIDNSAQTSRSMRSRGYLLRGRSAFSIYRFDNRDRSMVVALVVCIIIIGCGFVLDQNTAMYNPEIIFNAITPSSYIFYISYLVVGLLFTVGETKTHFSQNFHN